MRWLWLWLLVLWITGCSRSPDAAVLEIRREVVALQLAAQPIAHPEHWFEIHDHDYAQQLQQLTISVRTHETRLSADQRFQLSNFCATATAFARDYQRTVRSGNRAAWDALHLRHAALMAACSAVLTQLQP